MFKAVGIKAAVAMAMARVGNALTGIPRGYGAQNKKLSKIARELERSKPNGGHARGATAKQKRAATKRRNKAKNKRGSK